MNVALVQEMMKVVLEIEVLKMEVQVLKETVGRLQMQVDSLEDKVAEGSKCHEGSKSARDDGDEKGDAEELPR